MVFPVYTAPFFTNLYQKTKEYWFGSGEPTTPEWISSNQNLPVAKPSVGQIVPTETLSAGFAIGIAALVAYLMFKGKK